MLMPELGPTLSTSCGAKKERNDGGDGDESRTPWPIGRDVHFEADFGSNQPKFPELRACLYGTVSSSEVNSASCTLVMLKRSGLTCIASSMLKLLQYTINQH